MSETKYIVTTEEVFLGTMMEWIMPGWTERLAWAEAYLRERTFRRLQTPWAIREILTGKTKQGRIYPWRG